MKRKTKTSKKVKETTASSASIPSEAPSAGRKRIRGTSSSPEVSEDFAEESEENFDLDGKKAIDEEDE